MICNYTYLSCKAVMMEFVKAVCMPTAFLSILLHFLSALVRLLLENAMGMRMLLSGTLSL